MTPSRPVVVLGDVMVDVVAHAHRPLAHASDAAADISMRGGGAAANTASWLARLRRTALVGRVGDDAAGHHQLRLLREGGVKLAITIDPRRATGMCVVIVEPGGERTMLPDRGANLALAPEDVPAGLVERAVHVHVSGYALLDPGPRPAALAALARAQAAGIPTSVDPASAAPLAAVGADAFLAMVEGVDVLLPNADEIAVLTGDDDPLAAARALSRRSGAEVVVKLGADGAAWVDGGAPVIVPAAPGNPYDTTGAGDSFTAGYLHARLRGDDPATSLASGNAVAAQAIAQTGARPG